MSETLRVRRRPAELEAMRYTGADSCMAIYAWMGKPHRSDTRNCANVPIPVDTLDGVINAEVGDWIVKGPISGFRPMSPSEFAEAYEAVES